MSVKLIKVCKELNVAMSTLIQWREQNGIEVECDPKFPVSDELYEKLKQHFAQKPHASVRLDSTKLYGVADLCDDDDYCYEEDYDIIDDAFEGDAELYNDWLLN